MKATKETIRKFYKLFSTLNKAVSFVYMIHGQRHLKGLTNKQVKELIKLAKK